MDMNYRKKFKKRYMVLSGFIVIIFICLTLRLYYLQIYSYDELSSKAINQRGEEISLDPKRGIIFDRNRVPLTNNEIVQIAIVERSYVESNTELFNELRNNTLLSVEEFYKLIDSKERLLKIPLKDDNLLKKHKNNLFIVNTIHRYDKNNLLSHVIGYTNRSDNTGQAGIEKIYDEYLRKNDQNSFIVEYDRSRSLILDGDYYVNQNIDSYEPSGVKLTIDYRIQSVIEEIMDEKEVDGAVIVTEADSGEILGMASRPNYDQEKVEKSHSSKNMAFYNKAIGVGYPPGSVFKVVVLLAALEEEPDILDNNYFCKGYEEVNGNKPTKCSGQHGWISIEEGFAVSCNSVFIQIAKQIGGEKIIDTAKKVGFGDKINIGLLEEKEGNLPNKEEVKGAEIGNIAIGQGALDVTPLQISNLMSIIVNKGIKKPISLVKGITNKDGYMIKDIILDEEEQIISKESAKYAQDLLGSVVTKGTAKSIDLQDIGGAGGKTGSAEAVLNGKSVVHGWFSGFFPFDNPEYTISVLIEDSNLGSRDATPIFEEIVKEIYYLNR
ncbi:MAG TPA: penicillin-binding transpeptidase domain-containing protein [Tissierellaceae bacterium]|nr:penicillin-binding transpeptidase domain-containing protein [Tissierellaceae bacterium]